MIWGFIPDTYDLHAVKFKKGNINRALTSFLNLMESK
jgi:hypothetical protein